jgi:hypothetical protein
VIRSRATFLALALVASCGGGAAVPGTTPGAAPASAAAAVRNAAYRAGGPWRFAYERADTIISLLPNGGRQQLVLERKLQLAWVVTATPTGLALAVTIDSARVIGVPGGARAMEDSARGSVLRGTLSPQGVVTGLSTSSENGIARALLADLPWLLPPLGGEAPRTDTILSSIRYNVVDVSERTVRTTTPGIPFTMQGAVTREGASPQLTLSGSGTRQGSALLTGDGRPGQGTGRDSVAMTVAVVAMGQSIQIIQFGGYSLTPLP